MASGKDVLMGAEHESEGLWIVLSRKYLAEFLNMPPEMGQLVGPIQRKNRYIFLYFNSRRYKVSAHF